MKLSQLKGLGPKSEQALITIGITSAEELLQKNAYEVYAQLKAQEPATSLNMLYALLGAQQNLHWQEIRRLNKEQILMTLDDMGIAPE